MKEIEIIEISFHFQIFGFFAALTTRVALGKTDKNNNKRRVAKVEVSKRNTREGSFFTLPISFQTSLFSLFFLSLCVSFNVAKPMHASLWLVGEVNFPLDYCMLSIDF